LGAVIVLLIGAIVGYLVAGNDSAPTTTVLTTTTIPTTTTSSSTTTTIPTTTSTAPAPTGITIIAVEDTVIDSDEPEIPQGTTPVLEIEQDGDDIKRALVGFEVTGVPEGVAITGATLNLAVLDGAEEGGLVSLVDGPWTEAETTWSSAPPLGAQIAPLVATISGSLVEIDVTSAVTGNGRIDFYLSTDSDSGFDFSSRENPQSPPTLAISLADDGGATPEDSAVLVGAGDIASCDSEGDEATASLLDQVVAGASEAVVFTAGDNAYEAGSAANFADCYDPSWGRHKAITRPAPGSREYRTSGASAYYEYFGATAGNPGEGWYSYNLAGWHILSLNANCIEIGGCEAGSPQEVWLRDDLAAHSTACTLAYWHQPLFSSRSGGTNPEMVPFFQALYDADADIVISGNDHFYERFLPQDPTGEEDDEGVTQFTVGTGGRSLDDFEGPTANSGLRFNESFGVLALTLFPGGYEWEFVTPPGIQFTDTGGASCV
jgi:acid phosphatase type 7